MTTRALHVAAVAASLLLFSCTSSREQAADVIVVEGNVTVRGNEPFAAHLLQTDENNYYVLRFREVAAPSTPARLNVTGRLYRGEWDGRPFAHIDVQSVEPAR